MKMGKVHMSLKLHRQGLEYVKLANTNLTTAMGSKHPFITGELNDLEMMANEDPEILMEKRIAKMHENITEVLCPCCGHKKKVMRDDPKSEERPWEKDRKVIKVMREDSMFFNTDL